MRAHEQQCEGVVLLRFFFGMRRRCQGLHRFSPPPCGFATPEVQEATRRNLYQPAAGISGQAFTRPLNRSRELRLLDGIFSCAEVMRAPNERAEHLRREFAQQLFGISAQRLHGQISSSGGPLMIGRTSMFMFSGSPPGPGAADARAAIANARAAVSTSTIQNPARNSLDSGNTPSVIGSPFLSA